MSKATLNMRAADSTSAVNATALTTDMRLPARKAENGGIFSRRGITGWQRTIDGTLRTYICASGSATEWLCHQIGAGIGSKLEELCLTAFDDSSSGITLAEFDIEFDDDPMADAIAFAMLGLWNYVTGLHTREDDEADAADAAAAAQGLEVER